MKKPILALITLTLLLVGCGTSATVVETRPPDIADTPPPVDAGDEAAPPTDDPAEAEAAPAATEPAEAPDPIAVDIPGAAGLTLKGTFYAAVPNSAPGVLLLHMYGQTRADWDELAKLLQDVGIASLAIDLRGYGQTGGAEDWQLAPQDVAAAMDWLGARDEVDAERLGAVGASIGANLTMVLGSRDPGVDVIGLLSPGFDYFRVEIGGLMALYGDRPTLLAASEGDGYSADTVRAMDSEAIGPTVLLVYDGAAHGTDMFDAEPGLIDDIVDFLEKYLMD